MKYVEYVDHIENIITITNDFGQYLNLSNRQLRELSLAAKYHDIGKKYIPDEILYKEERLTDEEFNEIKKHPELSYIMAKDIGILDKNVLDAIIQHHEKIDGSGYPFGLQGDKISLLAKILSICDSYEAMIAERCYKKALSKEEAMEKIRVQLGKQFDRDLGIRFIEFLGSKKNREAC